MPAALDQPPRWTWWLPLPLFLLATGLLLASQLIGGVVLWPLSFALGLVFILWWGPRILPLLYLSATLGAPLWGVDWQWAPLYAAAETLCVGLAWLLVWRRGFDVALPDCSQLLRFMLLGVMLPAILLALGTLGTLLLSGESPPGGWGMASLFLWQTDCLSAIAIAIPLLSYVTPALRRRGWILELPGSDASPAALPSTLPPWPLLLALLFGLPWLLGLVPAPLSLPLLALVMFGMALAWGFAGALCGAGLSLLSVLAQPLLPGLGVGEQTDPHSNLLHLGLLVLLCSALLVGRNLSDLRLALERRGQVKQLSALASLALESSPLGITIVDARHPELPLMYCNPAFERISGYACEEILGRNCRFLLQDDHNQHELLRLRSALESGEPCEVVLRNYRKNGSLFWNEITLAPMRDEQGISHYLGIQHDVTRREQQTLELEARREELLRKTHLLSQTEAIADLGGWVLEFPSYSMFWSAGCFRIFGLEPGLAVPNYEQVRSYFDAQSRALAEQTMRELLHQGRDFDLELRLLSTRDNPRWVRVKGFAERKDGQLVRIYGAIQDISARKRAERQLQERDEWLRMFFEAPLIGMAMINPQQQWLEVNAKLCQILGRSGEQLRESACPSITHPDDLALEEPLFAAIKAGARDDYELDKRFLRPDGSVVYSRLSLRAVRDQQGRLQACLVLIEDITARREAEARYQILVEHAPEAILLFDAEQGIVEANGNASKLFGLPRDQLLGQQLDALSPSQQANGQSSQVLAEQLLSATLMGETPLFDWLIRDASGRVRPCEVRPVRLPGGERPLVRLSITDISERQRYQREIERLAYSDELTGLPNRRLLLDRLQHAMVRERREGRYGALLFIDLDHFKAVNDSLGHPTGDALLREVSARLGSYLRAEDTLARLGGDEFVVLLEALADTPEHAARHAAEVGEKLLESLHERYQIDGHELSVGASIGITLHPFDMQDAAAALKQADTAMYGAKQGGRNALPVFAADMQATIDQRQHLQSELRQAIARSQLHLVFQPQLELISGRVTGAEALLRWSHPERGEIAPSQFIPLAVDAGLIQEFGGWVVEEACAALARWLKRWPHLVLAINLSPRELRLPDTAERIADCLRRNGLPPTALELEITEGVMLDDIEHCIAAMQALKELGVRFALDDFGVGHSSLTHLQRLPLDRLKIDRSFIGALEHPTRGLALVETMLLIARNLGLECVAEGIETQAQLDCLRQRGCTLGQGFHFSKPLAEAEFTRWMDAR